MYMPFLVLQNINRKHTTDCIHKKIIQKHSKLIVFIKKNQPKTH